MKLKQGDIYWTDFGDDPTCSEPAFKRPCVVIQNNVFNESTINTVVVVPLTSNLIRASAMGNVLLNKGEANLSKKSVINISQIMTVNKSDLYKKIGTLTKQRIDELIDGIKLLINPLDLD